MRPTLSTLKIESKLNLSFLLKSDPNLLFTLHLARTNLQNILDAINGRSKFYLEEVQPKLERSGLKKKGESTLDEIQASLGERIYQIMLQTTNDIIKKVESSLMSLESAENELRKALMETFPEDKVTFLSVSEGGVDKK